MHTKYGQSKSEYNFKELLTNTTTASKYIPTLDSGINVGVRLLIFEKFWRKKKLKNDRNALIDVKMN